MVHETGKRTESLPVFWVGMVLIALFAVQLPLFPSFGAVTPWKRLDGMAWASDVVHHLILPMVTLALASVSQTFVVARTAVAACLAEPFVAAARARGLARRQVLTEHIVPHALLPIVTAAAMNLALTLGGATLTETVFSYPGLGRLIYEAVLSRDYPVLQGAFLVSTFVVIVVNLILDVAYPWLDPRLRGSASPATGRAA